MLPGLSFILLIVVSCPHTVNCILTSQSIHCLCQILEMPVLPTHSLLFRMTHSPSWDSLQYRSSFSTVNFRLVVQKCNIGFQVGQSHLAKLSSLPNVIGQFIFQCCILWTTEIYGTFVDSGLGTRRLCQEYGTPAWPWNEATLLFVMMQFICSGYTVKLEARTVAG